MGRTTSSLGILLGMLATVSGVSRVKLAAHSQTTIPVPVPGGARRNVPISLTTNLRLAGAGLEPGEDNLVEFSVSHLGHLTHWAVMLRSGQHSAEINKSLCLQHNSTQSNTFTGDLIYVVAYSRTNNELQLEVGADWSGLFLLSLSQPTEIDVNPNTTQTFQFSPSQYRDGEESSVLVEINSSSSTCLYVAINQPGCPWHHSLNTIHNSVLWARLLHKGYFTVERRQFPDGFTLTFISLTNNSECVSEHSPATLSTNPTKRITLRIKDQTTSYTKPVITAILSLLATGIFFSWVWLASWTFYRRTYLEEAETDGYEMTGQESLETQRSERELEEFQDRNVLTAGLYQVLSRLDDCPDSSQMNSVRAASRRLRKLRDDDLSLADLSVHIRASDWHRRLRSRLYLLLVPLLAIFYLIPSFQLVYAELTTAQQLGNIDRCYFNFGCARPFWIFPDFNHTISNCGYIIYGIFFIAVVYFKSRTLPSEQNRPTVDHRSSVGLVQQYSLFYTLGICSVLQGIFSVIFHICPSNTSLQFDTTMM